MPSDFLFSRWRDRVSVGRLIALLALPPLLLPGTVIAQMPAATTPAFRVLPSTTDPMSAPSHLDLAAPARYARYVPSFCAEVDGRSRAVASSERLVTWHDRRPQSVASRQADSVYNATKMQAAFSETRACLASFTLASATPYQMWALGKGWLTVGEEAKAADAFTQFLKSQARSPVEERAWWLQQLVSVYSGSGPSGRRTALAYLARLDSLGEPAIGFRIVARNGLYSAAQGADDIPSMREFATAARTLSFALTGDGQREWMRSILESTINLADVDYRTGKAAVAKDSLERAIKMYRPIDPVLVGLLREPLAAATAVSGEALAPAPKAMFIYYPGQKTFEKAFRDSLQGKPTLYIQLVGTRLTGRLDFGLYALAARVREQFGDRVNIVAVGTTRGSYAHRLVKDTAEAEQLRVLAHDYLHLPITLAIFSSQITGSDEYGRVIRTSPVALRPIVLVDKRGVIRDLSRQLAPVRTINMIAELLKQ